jgi:hypothetical protein
MPEHEVRGDRAVYDHETEDPRGARRRRPVADWGVNEEIFDRMPSPRRRFGRAGETPPSRRDSHARDRRLEAAPHEEAAARAVAIDKVDERAERVERARRREAAAVVAREAGMAEPATDELEVPLRDIPPAPVAPTRRGTTPQGGVAGRRTVVIGGQASAARRPRPARTVGERVGPRPDRLAAYAVALGVLLILIAFLTQ